MNTTLFRSSCSSVKTQKQTQTQTLTLMQMEAEMKMETEEKRMEYIEVMMESDTKVGHININNLVSEVDMNWEGVVSMSTPSPGW